MKRDWNALFSTLDQLLVSSDYITARRLLQEVIDHGKIGRRNSFRLVRPLCEAGFAVEALNLVAPYLRPMIKDDHALFERVEYARALVFSGTGQSAVSVLLPKRKELGN